MGYFGHWLGVNGIVIIYDVGSNPKAIYSLPCSPVAPCNKLKKLS